MICPQCSTVNDAGRKFCMECGAHLATGCPNCGAQNPAEAKFCGECGTVLSSSASLPRAAVPAREAQPAAPTAERRLVTVLFADLVGFTTQSQNEDPEDTREFLTRYFDLARTIVDRYGGTIEKFIGDAVMAVWGTPTTHEDDAERAVRAALEMVAGVPTLTETRNVQARAGVLTGQAAVTIGASGQGMVAGDLVNTASRLQSVAPPGEVLVGEQTFRAVSGAIRFEEAGEQTLKGKTAPVPAWRAAAVVGLRGSSGRDGALEPPFTGRDDELRLIKELFHATQRENKARLVSVIGQGGMGKSRLAWEFEKYLDGVVEQVWWHVGRSPAYGEGISYWALAEMVRGRAGIAESDDPSVAAARLHEALGQWISDEQESRWVEPRLAALLALEPMPPGSRDELFAAWRTFFERIAQRGPAVLVFEDIQWADEGMLDFITELLDRSRNLPIFVVSLARPELFDRRPGWGQNLRSLTSMVLDPLDRTQMAQLVTGTVPGIPDDATKAVVNRADGIPLYAVETLRMLLDRGDLQRTEDGRFEINGRLDSLAVPDTLQALIASRLDALGERDRRLVQAAAVVGQSFTIEALAAVASESLDTARQQLAGLVQRQILQVDVDPRSPERGQYQFVQAVVREVAEASLARSDRRALHVAAARYYETLGDDELAGVLASHYIEAYRSTPEGPEADALAAQARVSLRGAADRAIELHSYRQAVAYLEQALAVTKDPAEQAVLHERVASPAMQGGLFDAALEHAQAVESLNRGRGDRLGALRGLILQARAHMTEHNERPVIALLRPALAEVADLPPSREIVEAQGELGRALMISGDIEAIDWCDRALAAAALVPDDEVLDIVITKGTTLSNVGRYVEGESLLMGAMQVAEHNGLIAAALRARNNLLGIVSSDDSAAAAQLLSDGYDIAMRYGFITWAYQFAHSALDATFETGDWDAWTERARELDASGFYGGWREVSDAMRLSMRGRMEDARAKLSKARALVGTTSTQAVTGMAGVESGIEFASGNWEAVLPAARKGWVHSDTADYPIVIAAATAAAANRPDWATEAAAAYGAIERRGVQVDGVRGFLATVVAMLGGKWQEARASYLAARRDLTAANSNFTLALLNLSVAARGEGHIPEAREAAASAEQFFTRVGAEAFLDTYRAKFVPGDPATSTTPAGSVHSSARVAAS
jgi:class 3 adenylate cyclase/tetratricopeptide (TPR) repeat protein